MNQPDDDDDDDDDGESIVCCFCCLDFATEDWCWDSFVFVRRVVVVVVVVVDLTSSSPDDDDDDDDAGLGILRGYRRGDSSRHNRRDGQCNMWPGGARLGQGLLGRLAVCTGVAFGRAGVRFRPEVFFFGGGGVVCVDGTEPSNRKDLQRNRFLSGAPHYLQSTFFVMHVPTYLVMELRAYFPILGGKKYAGIYRSKLRDPTFQETPSRLAAN